MLRNILSFELQYWMRRPMVYVFLFINVLLVFFGVTSDDVTIGQSYGSVHKNAPFVVMGMYANMSVIVLLMITAFAQAYKHQQARIIEFPRYASFAQAFPGTMPYSEGIGFIAQIEDEEDIDMVFYVVAHEMAHQWWAHQVIGAKMQGATLLSETMSQ